jgi:hypothetical protein
MHTKASTRTIRQTYECMKTHRRRFDSSKQWADMPRLAGRSKSLRDAYRRGSRIEVRIE